MNALRETIQTIPKTTIYRVAGGVALVSAIAALAVSALLRPYLGSVVGHAVVPFVAALVVWTSAGVTRLRVVGFLPSQADHLIPARLEPWLRVWLLARFGFLGSMLLVLVAIVAVAVAGGPFHYGVDAFVYVAIARMFMDLIFGTALNVGIIARRHSTG